MKKTGMKKSIALLLSVIMIMLSVPFVSHAEPGNTTRQNENYLTEETTDSTLSQSEMSVEDGLSASLEEIVDMREENVKHFRLSDGSYQAVVYSEAVHRRSANGKWVDIDNRLSEVTTTTGTRYSTADGRVSFAAQAGSGSRVMTLSEKGYRISLSLATGTGLETSSADVRNHEARTDTLLRASGVSDSAERVGILSDVNNTTKITYPGLLADTDLEYILSSNRVKENVILYAPASSYEYRFDLQLEGLTAVRYDNGVIELLDAVTQKAAYRIPLPYMYDANGERSWDVEYRMNDLGNGNYRLILTADAEWIQASERAFPVTIDPGIEVKVPIWDTYISSAAKDTNFGGSDELWVGSGYITYINTIMPSLPEQANITLAQLKVRYSYHAANDGELRAGAYKVTSDWDENTLTWNSANSGGNTASTCLSTETFSGNVGALWNSPKEGIFVVTDAVRDWYNGEENYGIAVKYRGGTNYSVIFHSSDTGNEHRPRFYIAYEVTTVPDGVYALGNIGNGGLWMDVQHSSTDPGAHMQQYEYTPDPISMGDPSGQFKITRVSGTNRYIIRSMLNQNLSFGISGTDVLTKTIPATDSQVAAADTFYLVYSLGGFIIRPYGSSYSITAKNTRASGMGGAPDSYLTVVAQGSETNQARWVPHNAYAFVEDGVYAFRVLGNPSRWMDVQNDSYEAGKHLQQYDYGASPAENFLRGGLFKISRVGNTEWHIIRLMTNNRLSFYVSGNEVLTKEIPLDDADVSLQDTFRFIISDGSYLIQPYGRSDYIGANATIASGAEGAPDSYLIPRDLCDCSRWKMYRYTGISRSNVVAEHYGLKEGEYSAINITSWSTIINANDPYVYIAPASVDSVDSSWNIGDSKIVVRPNESGSLELRVNIRKNGITKSTISVTLTVNRNLDPLYAGNVESITVIKITSPTTEHVLMVIEPSIAIDDTFIVINVKTDMVRSFSITDELIRELEGLESAYQAYDFPFRDSSLQEAAAHAAKGETDQMVDAGYMRYRSSAYYGTWASNYAEELNLVHTLTQFVDTFTVIYGMYMSATKMYYANLYNSSGSLNSYQYSQKLSQADDILSQMTNNESSNSVMLGTNVDGVSWYELGEEKGMSYFYSPQWDSLVSQYGQDVMYAVNRAYIIREFKLGKTFYFSHDPVKTLERYSNSSYGKELQLLKELYNIDEFNDTNLQELGGYWKFVPNS